jgi:hypothetical protein
LPRCFAGSKPEQGDARSNRGAIAPADCYAIN